MKQIHMNLINPHKIYSDTNTSNEETAQNSKSNAPKISQSSSAITEAQNVDKLIEDCEMLVDEVSGFKGVKRRREICHDYSTSGDSKPSKLMAIPVDQKNETSQNNSSNENQRFSNDVLENDPTYDCSEDEFPGFSFVKEPNDLPPTNKS